VAPPVFKTAPVVSASTQEHRFALSCKGFRIFWHPRVNSRIRAYQGVSFTKTFTPAREPPLVYRVGRETASGASGNR
jgi:hypothetical protein